MELNLSNITIEDGTIEVDYKFYPAVRGARDSLNGIRGAGPPIEPDEPACVELQSVKLFGHEVYVDYATTTKIEEAIMEQLGEGDE